MLLRWGATGGGRSEVTKPYCGALAFYYLGRGGRGGGELGWVGLSWVGLRGVGLGSWVG